MKELEMVSYFFIYKSSKIRKNFFDCASKDDYTINTVVVLK